MRIVCSKLVCHCVYRRGNCKKASVGLLCEVGLRCRTYYVLCGSVLSVWNELEEVLSPVSGTNVKVQIVRLRTEDGQRIVGKLKDSTGSHRLQIVKNKSRFLGFVYQKCEHFFFIQTVSGGVLKIHVKMWSPIAAWV